MQLEGGSLGNVDRNSSGERSPADQLIADRVRHQHGVITRRQLRALGVNDDAVDYRVQIGRLQRLHRGVYAVDHRAPSQYARMLAAVLACGDHAVLGWTSAAVLWGLLRADDGAPIDVIVQRRVRQPSGLSIHRSSTLAAAARTRQFGIPVTTPAHTLLDLAQTADARTLSRAIRQAEVRGLVKHQALVELATTSRRGAPALRAALAPGPTATRSSLEDAVVDALRGRSGTPSFTTNTRISGREVDLYFPKLDLAVELDSERYHDTPQAQWDDARKQAHLESAGHRVLRVPFADPSR